MRPLPPLTPSFEAALRDAHATGMDFRLAAALRLGDAPTPDRAAALAALRHLAADAMGPIRAAALASLGLLEDVDSLPLFHRALSDADHGARQAALEAAGRLRTRGGLALIDRGLASERVELRYGAVAALRGASAKLVGKRLAARLRDDDPAVRAAAAEGLGELDAADAKAHREPLARLLQDPVEDVARTAALALAEWGDARGVAVLIGALADRRFTLDAADALGRLGASEARDPLEALLDRRLLSPAVHAEAAGALCRLGSKRGPEGLRGVLRAFRADGRSRAAELVGELQLGELLPELTRLRRRPRGCDPGVVERALAKLEHPELEPAGCENKSAKLGSRLRPDTHP